MDYKNALLSLVYSVGQLTLGLLLHPYQTMQSLVEDKVFVWMALLPTGVLAVVTVLWRFVIVPLVQLVFSCQKTGFIGCAWLPFLSNWLTFFCIYWQILLLYLLFRFSSVFNQSGAAFYLYNGSCAGVLRRRLESDCLDWLRAGKKSSTA